MSAIIDDQDLERLISAIADAITSKLLNQPQTASARLMTIEQAAIYIGRSEIAVREMVKNGTLPVVKLDRRLQIDRYKLDKLITKKTADVV